SSARPAGAPSTTTSPPARAASSASIASPALSMRSTADRSIRRTPSAAADAGRHSAATSSRSSAPANASASPSRRTPALLLGIRVELALAQLGGDLGDRLVLQLLVELLAEGLHERHALDHHVEHLPLAAGLAHQVVDRDRVAVAAQHLA